MTLDSVLRICLGPILVLQGRQVRKRTPRLPEAPGARKGIQGEGGRPLRLLVLGDSAAAGVGIDSQANSLTGQLLAGFGPEFEVSWQLMARSGITTPQMIEEIEAAPEKSFDIAVTCLGVNDVKAGVDPVTWLGHQKTLICLWIRT